jgi:hypothetical protein
MGTEHNFRHRTLGFFGSRMPGLTLSPRRGAVAILGCLGIGTLRAGVAARIGGPRRGTQRQHRKTQLAHGVVAISTLPLRECRSAVAFAQADRGGDHANA